MLFAGKSKYDRIIVGLGNPGDKYSETRHNAGFRCIDILANDLGAGAEKNKFHSLIREAKIGTHNVLLCKPLTFMNESGTAVSEIIKFYKNNPETLIIVSDDIAMDAGRLRIRASGSHGGHNGLKDIIELCGTDKIPRVKIGMGQKPHPEYDLADWVLSRPSGEDKKKTDAAEKDAAVAVKAMVLTDITTAMNRYNR